MIKNYGFCIRCREKIPVSIENPLCMTCGGSCSAINRFSSTEMNDMFCHNCGETDYVSFENPLCFECRKKKD